MSATTLPAVTTAPSTPPSGALERLRWAIHDGLVVCKRNLLQVPRVPELLVFSTIQPIMFVLLFAFVFGSAIPIPGGGSYKEFLMAGIFAQIAAFASANTTVGVAEDMTKGLVDRFRSLPMARSAVLVGRSASDVVRLVFQFVIMSITGYLVGWRINDGIPKAIAAYLLLLLFGFAMTWIGSWIGLSVKSVEVANTAGFIWLFPLTFLSNAFVPTVGMPPVLQWIADWNPISATVAACRQLWGNPNPFAGDTLPARYPILLSLGWSTVILAIFVPLSIGKYRSATARWHAPLGSSAVSQNPEVLDRTDPVLSDGDHERFAHIIRKSDEMKGYVLGEEVTALCGKKWIPSRDPQKFPVCPTCREVLSSLR